MGTGETSQAATTPKEGTSSQCRWNHQLCRRSVSWNTAVSHQSGEDPHDLGTHMAKDT
ncbi:hypothetical protein ID866_9389 [Astraeus odoratus]|nr:hypothetical protein ID866_9389 [Astraeus odoratus]